MARAVALIDAGPETAHPVVAVRGEVDVGTAPALRDWLARASAGGRRAIVVDLSGVDFLAVSGLYVLCDEQQRMAAHQARLTVVCRDARALRLMAVCGLDEALHVVPSRAAAVRDGWDAADDARAGRLDAWLQRYAAASA